MKKIGMLLILFFALSITSSEAQVLKGFGKKLEKKIEERIDRKADRHVEKVLDKADKKTDQPIDGVIDGNQASKNKDNKKNGTKGSPTTSVNNKDQVNLGQVYSEGSLVISGGSCTDFIWFKKGAMMEFETKDGKGKLLNRSKMLITSVVEQGGVTVANVQATDNEGNEVEMQFKCAGDKMYMDFGSMIQQAMVKAGQSGGNEAQIKQALDNTEMSFSDGFMSFPKNMQVGQNLDDVSFSMISKPAPNVSMEISSSLEERKVVAKETVSTSAGSFNCVKITGVRRTKIKVMGMNQNPKPESDHLWFAPNIGLIKQETYNDKGKLNTTMVLTAYKL